MTALDAPTTAFDVPRDPGGDSGDTAPCDWNFARRTPASARERILAAASYLFCHNGFSATGIDTILARAGTAKATLYNHFPSKDALIEAVLDVEGAAWRRWFFGRLGAVRGTPQDRVLAVFDVLHDWFTDENYYGCPFINAVAEFDTGNPAIKAAADRHKTHLFTWLKAAAIEMQVPDPDAVARAMVVLVDGAIVAAQHAGNPGFARDAQAVARTYLASLPR